MMNAGPPSDAPATVLDKVSQALPHPIVLVNRAGWIVDANPAAEAFFDMSVPFLQRHSLERLAGPNSPLAALIRQSQEAEASFNLYRMQLSGPRISGERLVDVHAAPLPDVNDLTLVMIQERTIADKFSRQLAHRGSLRSVSAMAAMLAHEIKNPLSGIRGAAQLLDSAVSDEDRTLTQLIRDETDRIVKLVDRFDMFSDERVPAVAPVNIHSVLDHVRVLARSGFARDVRITVDYDPSLPLIRCNRDQMIQVFINLIKNAAEAVGDGLDGEIQLTTAYRPGVRMMLPGSSEKVRLPLEVCICDNGPGVPEDIRRNLFDPFVTTKSSGSGLGLALVAKVIGDHGGIVECESVPKRTIFRLLLPLDGQAVSDALNDET